MSNLVTHAERELRAAGLFDPKSDYDGMLGQCVLDLVKKFAEQGHSGFSAHLTISLFKQVASFKTLGPLTQDTSEWMEVAGDDPKTWQSLRQSSCFSLDGGKTYYDLDGPRPLWRRLLVRLGLRQHPFQFKTYRTAEKRP